ncbi:MAG: sigma-70 family RNA polymerase sigma factor [Planctomycetales bacterium]|nr:sigma-70 family RNA polymerase sigma factor [Planctomycetales bacterium]
MLLAFLRSAGCDTTTADDVWQETMLVAWRRLDEFDRSRPFGPWLRGIAIRVLLNWNRRNSSSLQLIGDVETLDYLCERFDRIQSLAGDTLQEKLEVLRDCLNDLPPTYRECIALRFENDLAPSGISEKLCVALETVKKRLLRAKQRLLQCMETKYPNKSLQGQR